jgi:hypothetical protein
MSVPPPLLLLLVPHTALLLLLQVPLQPVVQSLVSWLAAAAQPRLLRPQLLRGQLSPGKVVG